MPVGYTSCRSVQALGFSDFGHLTPARRLISASCSSGQRFAIGLPSDSQSPAKPLPLANSSPCRASRGLSPPSGCALLGAPKKTPNHTIGRFRFNSLTMSYFHTGIRTIIGAEAFHCPVRYGKEWYHLAMVIRHNLLFI